MWQRLFVRLPAVLAVVASAACAPRLRPLTGVSHVGPIPITEIPAGHSRLIFRWEYRDPLFGSRGEGVARMASPDSVRLDFFVDGGVGGGAAVLIGDSIRTATDDGTRYLPPIPLLWAALGVLRVTGADTVARTEHDSLFVELVDGRSVYRATFVGSGIAGLGRGEGGRLREQVRRDSSTITYRQFAARRRLTLTALRRVQDPPYDPAIWRP